MISVVKFATVMPITRRKRRGQKMEYEYQCHQCEANFKAEFKEEASYWFKAAVRCPQCGSKDVERLNVSSDIAEFLSSLMHSGGG